MSTDNWREIKSGDVIEDGDRIKNPYGEEPVILDFHDGTRVTFDDGDTWTVAAMAGAWFIIKKRTPE